MSPALDFEVAHTPISTLKGQFRIIFRFTTENWYWNVLEDVVRVYPSPTYSGKWKFIMYQPSQKEELTFHCQYILDWLGTGISAIHWKTLWFRLKVVIWQPFWCQFPAAKKHRKEPSISGWTKVTHYNSPNSFFHEKSTGVSSFILLSSSQITHDHRLPNLHARLHGSDLLIPAISWNDIRHTSEAIFRIQPREVKRFRWNIMEPENDSSFDMVWCYTSGVYSVWKTWHDPISPMMLSLFWANAYQDCVGLSKGHLCLSWVFLERVLHYWTNQK